MKTRYLKVISAILALLMMASVMVIPSFAADELTGDALMQSLGYTGSKGTATAASARIVKDANNDSYLELKPTGESYPSYTLDSKIVPTDLTYYTVSMDLIVGQTGTNKLILMTYGKSSNNKFARVGFRYGAWKTSDTSQPDSTPTTQNIGVFDGTTSTFSQYHFGWDGPLKDVTVPEGVGTRVNVAITVKTVDGVTELTLKYDGITVPGFEMNSGVTISQSMVAFCAYKDSLYGYDNVKVVNHITDEVVYAEDFEPAAEQTITATAPAKDGKVFAGWYADAAFTTPVAAGATKGYAKFVVKNTLGLNVQISANTVAESVRTDLRLITTVDGTDYQKAGFMLKYEGKSAEKASTTVYSSITAMGADYKPTAVSHVAKYFSTFTLTNVPNAAFGKPIEVTPFWVTADGTVVTGNTVSVVINDLIA